MAELDSAGSLLATSTFFFLVAAGLLFHRIDPRRGLSTPTTTTGRSPHHPSSSVWLPSRPGLPDSFHLCHQLGDRLARASHLQSASLQISLTLRGPELLPWREADRTRGRLWHQAVRFGGRWECSLACYLLPDTSSSSTNHTAATRLHCSALTWRRRLAGVHSEVLSMVLSHQRS